MADVDFITALGRVLHDGALRDALAENPDAFVRRIGLREADRPAFLKLVPADLEFQAAVLLRKRFALLKPMLPATIRLLGKEAWPEFAVYSRSAPLPPHAATVCDAFGFCTHLQRRRPEVVCPVELNRSDFAFHQRRFSARIAAKHPSSRFPRLQLMLRLKGNRWWEWQVYFAT